MTFDQYAIVLILVVMLIVYATERFRVEMVAMVGLAAAVLLGVVPVGGVFGGFASPAVITVIEVLVIVAALAQTQAVDRFARAITDRTGSERGVLAILCGTAAFVSVFMNNIGALALVFPVALSVCARLDIAPARVLMPLSFATLLGGLCSLTGTPANLIVNGWKISETGAGFAYFELAWVGLPVALAGLAWIVLAAPRVFARARPAQPGRFEAGPTDFLAERAVPAASPLVGLHLADAERATGLHIHGVFRHGAHVFARRADIMVAADDILLVEGDVAGLGRMVADGRLAAPETPRDAEEVEAVVMPDSLLLGSRVGDVAAFAERAVAVRGLASRRHRVEGRFDDLKIGMGDVLIVAGDCDALREIVAECGLLALGPRRAERAQRPAAPSLVIFAVGVLVTALDLAPPELAFGGVVVAMAMARAVDLRTALQDLNWPIILLLGCMIPLGLAVEQTGAARVIADLIADHIPVSGPAGVAALVLLLAVLMTPFIDNVSTAAVLSPIAAGLASRTGVPIEPLLMAVAVGASLDFLTPFGHHNNAVVMGAAGYRFVDFPRLGAPLLGICLIVAIAVLAVLLV
ncbi:SLC13 family permease [Sphingopyxis panaciterrulae]|uniref:Di/tricarboxylate transporter n=1 Tax=Sphingopyxis panaciterrulae TaxID=462372 RepID=A0A7W9EQU5_9SPHN|nr:SLC13 family permease [Sphingopyxis panaciterrulae]MBB5706978.1 di/tricarboxylate transporter [Sphingopyxis panaciterrulae]